MWYEYSMLNFFFLILANLFLELILRPDGDSNACVGNRSHPATPFCTDLYGGAAEFCIEGQCRCQPNISFANGNNSRCCEYIEIVIS
jgi:hypothetical protein